MPSRSDASGYARQAGVEVRYAPPSWGASLVFHALALVGLWWMTEPRPMGRATQSLGTALEATYTATPSEDDYFDESPPSETTVRTELASARTETSASVIDSVGDAPPVDVSAFLPSPLEGESATTDGSSAFDAGEFTGGPSQPSIPQGGRAKTQLYGISADGYKFVYVFDRSGSMGGATFSALISAKAELLSSLGTLEDTHQFQIVFYNERPTVFPIAGHRDRLVFATQQNKQLAERFVRGITADGATAHEEPLAIALRMAPDVIFFLTDADHPELSREQMDRIQRMNAGQCAIHAIEFGLGPDSQSDNFLKRLARENGGKYVYRDVTRLRSARTSP